MMKTFQNPSLYAKHHRDNDYWILHYLFKASSWKPPKIFHPQLGWIKSSINPDTFTHDQAKHLGNRRPVLLFGDSFAQCKNKEKCFEDFLNENEEFSKNFYFLNYGVGGYGLDQIYLMFLNALDVYENPIIIFSFLTTDMDRSILFIRDYPKPFFELGKPSLVLHLPPPLQSYPQFFKENPPQINSYLYRLLLYGTTVIPRDPIGNYLKGEREKRKLKTQVNRMILSEVIRELNSRNMDFSFLIFHPKFIVETGYEEWRTRFLRKFLFENNITYMFTREILREHARKNEKTSFEEYFLVGDGHPTSYQNHIISNEIEAHLLKNRTSKFSKGIPPDPRL